MGKPVAFVPEVLAEERAEDHGGYRDVDDVDEGPVAICQPPLLPLTSPTCSEHELVEQVPCGVLRGGYLEQYCDELREVQEEQGAERRDGAEEQLVLEGVVRGGTRDLREGDEVKADEGDVCKKTSNERRPLNVVDGDKT